MSQAFFWISAAWPGPVRDEMNRFLATHRVLATERHFIADGQQSAWAITVDYEEPASVSVPTDIKKGRVDYREMLDPETFGVFATLRVHRKQVAEQEGVPVYAVFTNEHLVAIARMRPTTVTELASVPGVGEARVRKYGEGILAVLRNAGLGAEPTSAGFGAEPTEQEEP